jgi:two-component system LytT family response regulator
MMIRAIVADDEPLARRRLLDLIEPVEWLKCVAETGDGPTTIEQIDTLEPDLVFLDVRMPGATGLEVLEQVNVMPCVIFTTAYDAYAVTAFELQAIDYLLKPFSEDRFQMAIDRVRTLIDGSSRTESVAERAAEALSGRKAPLARLFVRTRGKILPLSVDEIVRLEAQGDFVMIQSSKGAHLVCVPLKELAVRLDAKRFVRVHRSHVVNLDFVQALQTYDGHRLIVELEDGSEIVASKTGTRLLRHLVL